VVTGQGRLNHLPPHLREICAILAAGLVRLRRHTAEELATDAAWTGLEAESSLHFVANQSGHANPTPRRLV
jgi:hypothetical protein